MHIEKLKIAGKEVMPFTIPSGIVTTQVSCLEKLAREIPELGILTTKSIGPEKREGNREPILYQYYPGCFVNAVGLTNPGAEEFAKELQQVNFPKDKFLLASIFGKNAEEFVYVARTLEDYVDGFELNLSCPHAKGYGMQLGQDPETVKEITREVVKNTLKPVFAKLTPNAGNIGEIALSAVKAGAYGIVAINTVGPGYCSIDGFPVLTNKVGGLSGKAILPIGLKCAKEIRSAVGNKTLLGVMGGISSARDIEEYYAVSKPDFFGIGSALAGMNNRTLQTYFSTIVNDIKNNTNFSSQFLQEVDMSYEKITIKQILDQNCGLKVFITNKNMRAEPGQFVFARLPEAGEKPFSIMDETPLTLGVLDRGLFTHQFNSLKEGDSFYVRGPYGQGIEVPTNSDVVLVGGGCGIAGLYLLAKRLSEGRKADITTLLAAKDKQHLPYLKEFARHGAVIIATEDGSLGYKGKVTDIFDNAEFCRRSYFFNCGPRAMVNAVLPLEFEVSSPEKIYSSVDYMTRCGVGICGSCADEKGRRTCVEGPFMNS